MFNGTLTNEKVIKNFYEHDGLIAIAKELTDLLRKNRTIDRKKEGTRAYAQVVEALAEKAQASAGGHERCCVAHDEPVRDVDGPEILTIKLAKT